MSPKKNKTAKSSLKKTGTMAATAAVSGKRRNFSLGILFFF
jgi:hypothetical protein